MGNDITHSGQLNLNVVKNYYRVMLGRKSVFAVEAYKGNFIGADFDLDIDLTNRLPSNWREFNKEFIPKYLEKHSEKTKVAAGLACGFLYTVAKAILIKIANDKLRI